jgi:serine/threonine protein kinase
VTPAKRDSDARPDAPPNKGSSGADWFQLDSSSNNFGQSQPKGVPASEEFPAVSGYEILSEVRRGSAAEVFRARHAGSGQFVAIKLVRRFAGDDQRRQFLDRLQGWARLSHPGIAQVHEIGEWADGAFVALEWMAGGRLLDWLRRTPPSPHQATTLVESLARAVQFAHDHAIVHGCLGPQQVMLAEGVSAVQTESNPQRDAGATSPPPCILGIVPKIVDFAPAATIPQVQPRQGDRFAAPQYAAPEQIRGEPDALAPAVDVYALGAILYELLTGRPPFDGGSAEETALLVCEHEAVPPRWFRPRIPTPLETICMKCLERLPGRRYSRAGDFADDIKRFVANQPIIARPPGLVERLRRRLHRRRAWGL